MSQDEVTLAHIDDFEVLVLCNITVVDTLRAVFDFLFNEGCSDSILSLGLQDLLLFLSISDFLLDD